MLPAILPALKGLSLAQKILIPIGILIFLYGLKWGYDEYQQSVGREEEQLKTETALRIQAQASAEEYAKQVMILRQTVDRVNEERESFRERLVMANQEIQRYAKLNKVRRIDNDAIAIVNEFARVLNDQAHERVSDAGSATAEPAVEATAAPTTLDAFERLEELTGRLGECELKHRGLSEWAVENYKAEMEFYTKSPP